MMYDVIKTRISEELPGAKIYIKNPLRDGQHFYALVVTDLFEGMGAVERHRKILMTMEDELAGPLHALSLKALTTKEFDAQKGNLTKYLT